MHLTGTLIKNYFHCKRQTYLYYYGLNFSNEIVKIGEIMHKEKESKEFVFEKIKVDDIKGDYLIEYKKTSSNLEGTKMQVIYYLDYFHKKGLPLKAKIIDLTYKDEYIVEYNNKATKKLEQLKKDIKRVVQGRIPEKKKRKKDCKGCSFYSYCWLP